MSVSGAQDFWVVGARAYIQRDPIASVVQPWVDMGVVQNVESNFEREEAQLFDSDGGVRAEVARAQIQFTESYSLTLANFAPDNLALLLSAGPPAAYTRATSPVTTAAAVFAHPDRLVSIVDANGDLVYGVASIQKIWSNSGRTTPTTTGYLLDDDYEIVDLMRGLIRMKSGGTNTFDTAANIWIDYTLAELTDANSIRKISPQTAGGTINATMKLFLGRGGNEDQSVREARVAITPDATSLSSEEFSTFTANFTVLKDNSLGTDPAGKMLAIKGSIPAKS